MSDFDIRRTCPICMSDWKTHRNRIQLCSRYKEAKETIAELEAELAKYKKLANKNGRFVCKLRKQITELALKDKVIDIFARKCSTSIKCLINGKDRHLPETWIEWATAKAKGL